MIFLHKLKKFSKKLFVRATLSALIAISSALASSLWGEMIPEDLVEKMGTRSVDNILQIIASNMLVVVTFSLATMVAGYTSASQGVTPRAARILIENQKSENAISLFLGAFIFSIVSLVALSTEFYGRGGRFILFVLTCFLIITIVWTMIRWIGELSNLGRVHETIIKLEKSALKAFDKEGKNPNSSCHTYLDEPKDIVCIRSNEVGYVQSIDFEKLNRIAKKMNAQIYIKANPGAFVHANTEVVGLRKQTEGVCYQEAVTKVNNCFVVEDSRSIENDPRYNLIVLSEVASRALSSGVNDPGTAIDALRSATKVFHHWIDLRKKRAPRLKYTHLFIKKMTLEECFDDFFKPFSRDGAELIEVLIRLLEALQSMNSVGKCEKTLKESLERHKMRVLQRGQQCLKYDDDKKLLQKTYETFLEC